MVNQTHPQQVQQQLLGTATQLLQKRPFILWGAALVLVLLMGGLALKGLIYPGPLETTEAELPTTQPQPASPQRSTPQVPEVDSNLWLFGAVALGCAAGSVLISRRIERLASQPQASQPKTKKQRVVSSRSSAIPQTQTGTAATATRRPSAPPRRKKAVSGKKRSSTPVTVLQTEPVRVQQAAYTTSGVLEPVVTVVPENESHPLDWSEASLAEMMDIRKQKPLSSLL